MLLLLYVIVSIQLEMKSKCTIFYPQGTYYSYLSHAYTLYVVYMILVSYYVPMGVINEEVGKKVQTKRKCIYQGHLLYPPSKLCSLVGEEIIPPALKYSEWFFDAT